MILLRAVSLWPLWVGIVAANRGSEPMGIAACHVTTCGDNDVHVDVAIIGGGSGGIHAAIQLKDAGASVLVVEKKDQIGGHAETYINKETGILSNVGVVVFENRDIVRNYFSRLDVPFITTNPSNNGAARPTYDFSLGVRIPASEPAVQQQQQLALQDAAQAYSQHILSKYNWVDDGFLVPNPIPAELSMPFGELAEMYNFTALLPTMWRLNWYAGNLTTLPALYGIKNFGPGLFNSTFGGFIKPKSGNTRSIYDAALKELGSSILLNSTVLAMDRHSNSSGVTLLVSRRNKTPLRVCAKKLLVAIPPTLTNVGSYDLSKEEEILFSKFSALAYFAGIAHVPGFNGSFSNIGAFTPFNQPIIPGNNDFSSTGSPGDFLIGGGFNTDAITDEDGEELVRKNLATLAALGVVPADAAKTVTFPYTSKHTPFNLRVTAKDIRAGFYSTLLQLQGCRNTYWTGATFSGHNSALVWSWNQGTIVPGLKRDLGLN